MSSEISIKVEGLSKCYHIYDKPRDRLLQMLSRGRKQYFREFWALRDVSFEIRKGETVGIIGRNGSGKSTLLQLICGTLNPTSGNIRTHGRIAALLELGSGFNPEFSGRDNVYLNGAVLGLGKDEIDARFDAIAAFAEIGDFIDQPVKTYSSGMMVRLAFAVAINVDPEILIVDEALSVGDELFQRKCFSRIEAIRAKGATILFVSHSGSQIVELCDRAVLLSGGEKLAVGSPKRIVGHYQKLLYALAEKRNEIIEIIRGGDLEGDINDELVGASDAAQDSEKRAEPETEDSFDPYLKPISTIAYESRGATIDSPILLTQEGRVVNTLKRGELYRYCYTVKFDNSVANVRFGMLIKTVSGLELGGATSAPPFHSTLLFAEAGAEYRVEFLFRCALNPGVYFLNAGVVGECNGEETYLHRLIDIAMLKVMPDPESMATGIVDFSCAPKFERIRSAQMNKACL